MAIKNIHSVKSLDLLNLTSTIRAGWSSYRNITLCSTLRKASLKRSDKPFHMTHISKSSAANCIKESTRNGGIRADRRQSEFDQAAERLRICNRSLDEYYVKRQQYQNQYQKSIESKMPVLTRKLKDIMDPVYNPIRAESTMRFPTITSAQLLYDYDTPRESRSVRAGKPDSIGQYLLESKAATNRATNEESNPDDQPSLNKDKEAERKMWQLGARVIPCLDL